MEYRRLGKTDLEVSAVIYGGIVSSGIYNDVNYPQWGQAASDQYVSWAVEQGVNYFDVAPGYGNAQEQLGNSLIPYRSKVYLACKTMERSREGANRELDESLKLLHTDHFENYQLHAIKTMEDVEKAFRPDGIIGLLVEMKEQGIIKNIGFTAHSEEASLEMIRHFDFDTVLFPFNWFMNMEHSMGSRLIKTAKEKDMGVLGMKAFIERGWTDQAERYSSPYPKSWCKPIDHTDEEFCIAAMKYALYMGVDAIVPPGNFDHFRFAVEHIDECLANPFSAPDDAFLKERLESVKGKEFFVVC